MTGLIIISVFALLIGAWVFSALAVSVLSLIVALKGDRGE